LYCKSNLLSILPILPNTLIYLDYENNLIHYIINHIIQIDYNYMIQINHIIIINLKCNILEKFRFNYYLIRFRKRFRDFYFIKIKEPKIRASLHPSKLLEIIEENPSKNLLEIIDDFEKAVDAI